MQNNNALHIVIRQMESNDVAMVSALDKASFTDPWSEQAFCDVCLDENYVNLVATCEDKVVGFVCCLVTAYEADISSIAVDSDYRRCGIAAKLLECVFMILEEIDANKLFLEVRESNIPAQALYEKLGFVSLGARKNYYHTPTENAIIMQKEL